MSSPLLQLSREDAFWGGCLLAHQLISIMGLWCLMQLMRSKEKSETVERKACKGLLLTKKYLFTISPVWNLRKKPSFLLTKTVSTIKISHSSFTALSVPRNLQIMVEAVVGVMASRTRMQSLSHCSSYTSVTSSVVALAPFPYFTRDLWWEIHYTLSGAQALWWTAQTKDGIKTESLHSNPVRQAGLMVTADLIITAPVKTGTYDSQKWLSTLGTWNLAFINFSWHHNNH